MVGLRHTLAAMALGSALIASPAIAQGSSVSLTHTVSVTVPPRVKVQVGNLVPSAQSASSIAARPDGLAVSVSATQAWTLSIASVKGDSMVQWSTDRSTGFSLVGSNDSPIASGNISTLPAAATLFFRNAGRSGGDGSDMVTLTVVAP